jgi:putative membrane protein
MLLSFINPNDLVLVPFLNALLFALLGMVLFGLAFFIIIKVCPFSIRKEIEEDQNTSLGIVIGSIIIGIALILSAAIHG